MKKWFLLALGLAAIGLGWWVVRTYARYTPDWRMPKFGEVTRGDIRVPITAAGIIEPAERTEIKPEASGKVEEVLVVEGSYVAAGDVLVRLDPEDEQRNADRTKAALDRARINLAVSREAVREAEATVLVNQARVAELEAQLASYEFELNKLQDLAARELDVSQQQLVDAQARYDMNEAQLKAARAQVAIGRSRVLTAEKNVEIAETGLEEATKNHEDALERLEETTIRAPQDGLVTEVLEKLAKGALVQSGTQSLTGGTALMTLADISTMKVVTRVDESDYGKVHDIAPVGALPEVEALRAAAKKDAEQMKRRSGVVTLTVDAFPEEEFTGLIERVEPQGKLNTGASIIQFDVHVMITDERRFKLPLGAQAQVEFTVESVEDALLVPAEAIKTHEGERGVWVQTPSTDPTERYGRRFVRCRTGITDGERTQIIEVLGPGTLEPGQKVYTKLPPRDE